MSIRILEFVSVAQCFIGFEAGFMRASFTRISDVEMIQRASFMLILSDNFPRIQ